MPDPCTECERLANEYESLIKHLEAFINNCARLTGPAFERRIARTEELKAACDAAGNALEIHQRERHPV